MSIDREQQPERTEPLVAPARPGRVVSLDAIRGLFLLASVGSAAALEPRPAQLVHAAWLGLTAYDVIFPLFVTLSGCGLAFAYRNAVGWRPTLRRVAVLLLAGLAYNAVLAGSVDLSTLRWTGPLQIYAVLVLVTGALHRLVRRPAAWGALTLATAGAYLLLLARWQAGCPGAELAPTCNPSGPVDSHLLGPAHLYGAGVPGYDPEGVVVVLGALVTALAGVTAGHLLLDRRSAPRRALAALTAWAVVLASAGWAAQMVVPAFKRLWTPGFGLGIAALGVLALAVGHLLLDVPTQPTVGRFRDRLAWPLVALGRNSLLVYFGSHLLVHVLIQRGGDLSWAARLASSLSVIGPTRVAFVVVNVLGWAVVAALLHSRRIYLRP